MMMTASEELGAGPESSFLTAPQIEAAICYLIDTWPNQPLAPYQQVAWGDVLRVMRPGELKPALAAVGGRFRPDPYAVLEAVRATRPVAAPPEYCKPDWGAPASSDFTSAALSWCRARVRGEEISPAPWEVSHDHHHPH